MTSRAFPAAIIVLSLLIDISNGHLHTAKGESSRSNQVDFLGLLEDKLEIISGQYINSFTKWLANFNDRHLGTSEVGRFIHYDEIKPKLEKETARAKSSTGARMKKMAMAMMPLVFHVGATSTWMVLTSIMAVKSVMLGLALLVFKIAASSAKLASFFTQLKGKHEEHHGWGGWSPHHDYHHGHGSRSLMEIEHHTDYHQGDWDSYSPQHSDDQPVYNTIPISYRDSPSYKSSDEYIGPYAPDHKADKKFS